MHIYVHQRKKYAGQEIKTEKDMGVRAIFARGGGAVNYFSKWILASCPDFYETFVKKRGSYTMH